MVRRIMGGCGSSSWTAHQSSQCDHSLSFPFIDSVRVDRVYGSTMWPAVPSHLASSDPTYLPTNTASKTRAEQRSTEQRTRKSTTASKTRLAARPSFYDSAIARPLCLRADHQHHSIAQALGNYASHDRPSAAETNTSRRRLSKKSEQSRRVIHDPRKKVGRLCEMKESRSFSRGLNTQSPPPLTCRSFLADQTVATHHNSSIP
ncbi:uncharacterized protein J3D65DRAFT_195523 [Phyllosticta citribraziliensis]|uniref:Uncharacterized protein n=1 Tax=Phyllosticta citribraziliensis TaxID=989973 RepID=A0ABR1M336_9PEZI